MFFAICFVFSLEFKNFVDFLEAWEKCVNHTLPCNAKGWMNESVMGEWVEEVRTQRAGATQNPDDSVLILDSAPSCDEKLLRIVKCVVWLDEIDHFWLKNKFVRRSCTRKNRIFCTFERSRRLWKIFRCVFLVFRIQLGVDMWFFALHPFIFLQGNLLDV